MKDWTYKNSEITNPPEGMVGFVYLITSLTTRRAYIGKKFLYSRRRIKIFGRKNRKIVVKESDWKSYTGSNDELNADIKKIGIENFRREILEFYPSKREVSYAEVEQQFKRDVLKAKLKDGSFAYYNSNISGKWYRASKQLNKENDGG